MPLCYRVNKELFFLSPTSSPGNGVCSERKLSSCFLHTSSLARFFLSFQTQSLHLMEQALFNNWSHFLLQGLKKKREIYFPQITKGVITVICCLLCSGVLHPLSPLRSVSHSMYGKSAGCSPWDDFVNVFLQNTSTLSFPIMKET